MSDVKTNAITLTFYCICNTLHTWLLSRRRLTKLGFFSRASIALLQYVKVILVGPSLTYIMFHDTGTAQISIVFFYPILGFYLNFHPGQEILNFALRQIS